MLLSKLEAEDKTRILHMSLAVPETTGTQDDKADTAMIVAGK